MSATEQELKNRDAIKDYLYRFGKMLYRLAPSEEVAKFVFKYDPGQSENSDFARYERRLKNCVDISSGKSEIMEI